VTAVLLLAATDTAVAIWLPWHAKTRAQQPEPAAVTGLVLLLCALLLIGVHLTARQPSPPPPAPAPTVTNLPGGPGST